MKKWAAFVGTIALALCIGIGVTVIPKSYHGSKKYALYVTLPGYQGLYFQGVAQNIKTEDFGFEAQKYNKNMIIVAPQLNDWNQTSADQTIALVEYFLEHYQIDASKVYINGYSGGGETLSLVLGKRPELFAAALMCSSQWDGYLTIRKWLLLRSLFSCGIATFKIIIVLFC